MAARVIEDHVTTELRNGRRLRTPLWRVDSGRDGPLLLIDAAQHGNEVQGSEVIRRFTARHAQDLVTGSAVLVPFMNLPAVHHRRNSVMLGPEEKHTERHRTYNMNRKWPGDARGNDIERIAHALYTQVVRECTHVIDLHCWCALWATATLATDDGGDSRRMGEVTGTRFIRWSEAKRAEPPTQIRGLFVSRGRAAVTIELSGQYCVREREVQTGLRAVANIVRALGMLDGEPEIPPDSGIEVTDERTRVVEAPCRGLFVQAPGLQLEDRVEAGQRLGHIIREDLCTVEVTAPTSGWLSRLGSHRPAPDVKLPDQHPWSDPGNPLASIVT